MEKKEIIDSLAKGKVVERMVCNIAHQPMSADLADLAQMVYLALLEYRDDAVEEMWESGQINFFIARIILNNYRSNYSPFFRCIRRFQQNSADITGLEIADGTGAPASPKRTARHHRTMADSGPERAVTDFRTIKGDYRYNGDVFCEDDASMRSLKRAVDSLSPVDRTIILLYAECASLRELGAQLGVSHQTISNEVARIRKIVKENMK